ncbi:MAG TPA: alkaline phosphatase family protein [Polyangiaceae bacterium]
MLLLSLPGVLSACSSSSTAGNDAGAEASVAAPDSGSDAKAPAASCDGGSCIEHLVVIVQENHTFDGHFGAYCTATPGSSPTCNTGPACCEAMPKTDPAGTAPTVLTDALNGGYDPNHEAACELIEIDDGKMDQFGSNDAGGCGGPQNVVVADPATIKPYWDLAATGALADRYFQPIAGQSSANDMYLAAAKFLFEDNSNSPQGAAGQGCDQESLPVQFADKTIGDLLTAASVSWAWFSEGYQAMVSAGGVCPPKPTDCPASFSFYPCAFDPSDVPFEYFASTRDNPATMKDLSAFQAALTSGTGLPSVSFVKGIGYKTEHPGTGDKISAGVAFVTGLTAAIQASVYAPSTLVLVTYDEGGGYYDHVAPPATSAVDGKPYGTRVPTYALGPFAKKNFVSHVTMEHSSIVKFIEWNWLGQKTGQLGARDAVVNNLGSLLDPQTTGVAIPEN